MRARVILFKDSGKYYTEEEWEVPAGAIGPYDMERSPNFRRIGGGAVLVETQEPWGYPHLFPSPETPRHGDRGTCRACGAGIHYLEASQPTGLGTYEVLDAWWAHDFHAPDGHEAVAA